jgi:hypothetical protein
MSAEASLCGRCRQLSRSCRGARRPHDQPSHGHPLPYHQSSGNVRPASSGRAALPAAATRSDDRTYLQRASEIVGGQGSSWVCWSQRVPAGPAHKNGPPACRRPKSREETPKEGTRYLRSGPDKCLHDIAAICSCLHKLAGTLSSSFWV